MKKQNVNTEKMLLTNNDRKYHKKPLHRKSSKGKRYLTRKECMETISAFLDYCNGR